MPERVIIFGLGAQTKYVLETFAVSGQYRAASIVVFNPPDLMINHLCGVPITIWDEARLRTWQKSGIHQAIVVHSNNQSKAELMVRVKNLGFELVNAIHPRACIANTAQWGQNVIVNAQAVIQPFARLGNGVMVHAGVIVEHDNIIADFVNLAPGATLAGWVRVQEGAYIYTNATVIPQRIIGRHAIVGAGAVVLEDVPDYAVVVGNPARIIKFLPVPKNRA